MNGVEEDWKEVASANKVRPSAKVTVVNGVEEDWKEVASANKVRPSAKVTVVNGVEEDWKEVASANKVRPSAVTEKFPFTTSCLSAEAAVVTSLSPGPPGINVKETKMLPGRTSTFFKRDALTFIVSARACAIMTINACLLDSVLMCAPYSAMSLIWI